MNFNILYRPAHTIAQVQLEAAESIVAEAGAMIGMSTNVSMQTDAGGFKKGLKRLFGGESFFRNTFTANGSAGELLLAQSLCGDMAVLDITPQGFFVQSSCFIASTPNVQLDTKVGGFKGFFSGAGAFVLKATATSPGQLLVGGFGGIQEVMCNGDMVIDTGHLLAWDASLSYKIGKSGSGWIASFLSGEGLVCHFEGQGRIWMQTRNSQEYGQTVGSLLPARES